MCIRPVLAVVGAAAVLCLTPMQAHAETAATLSLSTSQIRSGESITITASYTFPLAAPVPAQVVLEITPSADATGTVERNTIPQNTIPPLGGCAWNQLAAFCLWPGGVPGQTASMTFTASASADAVGRWNVAAYSISYTPDLVPVRSVGATSSFVVDLTAPAPTTPVASTITTRSAGPTEPTPTPPSNAPLPPTRTALARVGGLPATGPREASTVVLLGVGFIAAGGLLIAITSRRPRHP